MMILKNSRKLLDEEEVDVNQQDRHKLTLLDCAIIGDSWRCAQLLIKKGADITSKGAIL